MTTVKKERITDLLEESQRLRDMLIKTVGRLDIFTDQLLEEASKLREATEDNEDE